MSASPITPPRRLQNAASAFADQAHMYWRILRGLAVVMRRRNYWHEALRQSYLLGVRTGSVVLVVGLCLAFGLIVGVQGSYAARNIGAPAAAAVATSVGNLRELVPYAFAYMMAAKVSTGFVAEIGTMRITEEIDGLDVMGFNSLAYLASTRLMGAWLILPFVYLIALSAAFFASYVVVVEQIGQASSGGYLELFWKYQDLTDLLFSGAKAMVMSVFVILVGCYYGYTVSGGPAEVGRATAKAMVVNLVGIHIIGILTTQLFWGGSPNLPIGG